MKKILAIAIGFGLILGTVSFAQDKMDDKKTDTTTKKKGKKKKSDDKTTTDKEDVVSWADCSGATGVVSPPFSPLLSRSVRQSFPSLLYRS